MRGRVVLITGATDGLGRALAQRRAAAGDRVIVHGRSRSRAEAVATEIGAAALGVVVADYTDITEVRTVKNQVAALTDRLDVLVNNAGVGTGEPAGLDRRLTRDGWELRFAVNHLATLLVTEDLLPLLRASAPARVVTVASAGQSPVDLEDLQLESGEYSSMRAYTSSKLAAIMGVMALAEGEDPALVTLNALHPATRMPTKIVTQNGTEPVDTVEDGLAAVERLIEDPALASVTGRYFNRLDETRAHEQAYDRATRDALLEASRRLLRPAAV